MLDTSCVRGTSRGALEILKERGFELFVSGLALSEVAVHFTSGVGADDSSAQRGKLRGRLRFFGEFFGGDVPLAPTHAPLVDKLGGRMVGIEEIAFEDWRATMRAAWQELTGSSDDEQAAAFLRSTAAYVTSTGQDFVDTVAAAAELGAPTEADIAMAKKIGRLLPSVLDFIRLPPPASKHERFDAYMRVQQSHMFRAYDRSVQRLKSVEPNHAIDLNLLHHLAEGLLVVTRDYELIEDVDASQSAQAPWVRTVGELLLGRFPAGLPFGFGARVAKRKHRARNRGYLASCDAEGEQIVRNARSDLRQ